MCRHELATREHMLDHGQLGPATPAAATPAISRRPSSSVGRGLGLSSSNRLQSPAGTPERPRRPSVLGESLSMSSLGAESTVSGLSPASRRSSSEKSPLQNLAEIPHTENMHSSSALESDEDEPIVAERKSASPVSMVESQTEISRRTAQLIGRRMSDAVISPLKDPQESPLESFQTMRYALDENHPQQAGEKTLPTTFISPSELAAELMTNPKLAALRTHGLETSPTPHLSRPPSQSQSAPILMNPKCSGYFVEPMKWMESFLSDGQIAGKIICPNPKCGAKLGNYDWAGVSCGCKEWVTPGFCINRSKVDEIVK
ncbi:hypothetical protein H0H93_001215 [Arthromyces matolae]|nr:hypothetical protein H0H93_001215 [Arthromyces matolae]